MSVLPKLLLHHQRKIMANKPQKKEPSVEFDSEIHFTVKEFCDVTGYSESFVREVMSNLEEFQCFVIDGISVIPKNAIWVNQAILNRLQNYY